MKHKWTALWLTLALFCTLLAGCEALQPPSQSQGTAPSPGETLTVHFIDVGQADAALLLCGGETMLIDGGNAEDSSLLVSYLEDLGVEHLVETPGDPAVGNVGQKGHQIDEDRPLPGVGPGLEKDQWEHRHQKQPEEGEQIGDGHKISPDFLWLAGGSGEGAQQGQRIEVHEEAEQDGFLDRFLVHQIAKAQQPGQDAHNDPRLEQAEEGPHGFI